MDSTFIQKHDPWGISRLIESMWNKHRASKIELFYFWIFFNQFVPEPYRASTEAVHRHYDEIVSLMEGRDVFQVWTKHGNQLKCVVLNDEVRDNLKRGIVSLPVYEEIEREKMKWQQHKDYRKEEGFSKPIVEEYIQLRIRK